ncbi:MAG: hypothetical protein KH421_10160 [Akkermansia muciniphila]|nr:hypothetical protein [Akkermansia muciniphila]
MIRLDLIRKAFDNAMLAQMKELLPGTPTPFVWLGLNVSSTPDLSKLHIITGFNPGESSTQELGGPGSLAIREGVYIITQSLPQGMNVDEAWRIASGLESYFWQFIRETPFYTGECCVWLDVPSTANRGTDPDQGRYLISTIIPWYTAYSGGAKE